MDPKILKHPVYKVRSEELSVRLANYRSNEPINHRQRDNLNVIEDRLSAPLIIYETILKYSDLIFENVNEQSICIEKWCQENWYLKAIGNSLFYRIKFVIFHSVLFFHFLLWLNF